MSNEQVAELREDIRLLNQTIISECRDIHHLLQDNANI